jgi:1-carboxybiuret hydrolase
VRRHAYLEAVELFSRFDLLIAAAAPSIAPRVGQETITINDRSIPTKAGLGLLTQPLSCIGLPVCTAPIWPGQMPIGVQLIAAPWREDLCLAAARALERSGVAAVRAAFEPA